MGLARTPQPRDDYLVELGDEHDQAGPAFRAYRLVPMEEPPQEEAASPFGRWFDGVFASLIALIGGAMVVTMYTGLDWSEPWWLTALIIPLLVVVASGLAWVLTCAILSALASVVETRARRHV